MDGPLLQHADPGCARWAVRVRSGLLMVSLTGWDPRLVPEYLVRLDEDEDRVVVDVQQSREQADGEFWWTSGHRRRAVARLSAPLAGRLVVDPQGLRLPVADGSTLLAPPAPWDLVHEEYRHGPDWAWESAYSAGGRQVDVRQGGAALVDLDWSRASFSPVLLDRPRVRGHLAELVTFSGEEDSNFLIAWRDSDRAVAVQALSSLSADELVQFAQALASQSDSA